MGLWTSSSPSLHTLCHWSNSITHLWQCMVRTHQYTPPSICDRMGPITEGWWRWTSQGWPVKFTSQVTHHLETLWKVTNDYSVGSTIRKNATRTPDEARASLNQFLFSWFTVQSRERDGGFFLTILSFPGITGVCKRWYTSTVRVLVKEN